MSQVTVLLSCHKLHIFASLPDSSEWVVNFVRPMNKSISFLLLCYLQQRSINLSVLLLIQVVEVLINT